jgi:hypothetical protein
MALTSKRLSGNQRLVEAEKTPASAVVKDEVGEHIEIIQQTLLDVGIHFPRFGRDGYYGDETVHAVLHYQGQAKLARNGTAVNGDMLRQLDAFCTAHNLAPLTHREHNLDHNLQVARQAVNYVLVQTGMKGANWDAYGTNPSYEHDGDAYKDALDVCVYDVVRPTYMTLLRGAKSMLDKIRIIANTARKNKCGNCGEFSALAFIYLYDLGVRPLDWMGLLGGDHAFVVIGRQAGKATDWKKWGAAAVVCDAWGEGFRGGDRATGVYRARFFGPEMRGLLPFTGVESIHRES